MKHILIVILFMCSVAAKVINFSPLPMDKAPKLFIQYNEMLEYLEKETGYKFNFVYSASYKELIKNFKDGKIDIIELGALPYLKLKETFKEAEPFITFNSQDGKAHYTCDIVTTDPKIKNFQDIKNTHQVTLTRSLSTCGYLMSELMMKNNNKTLEDFSYEYVGTHSNVLLKLLLNDNTIGTVKSTVLNKYQQFEFTTLAQSINIPGFALISNKNTLSNKEITKIKKAILKLQPLQNKKDQELVLNWSTNTKYGAISTTESSYAEIQKAMNEIKIPKRVEK